LERLLGSGGDGRRPQRSLDVPQLRRGLLSAGQASRPRLLHGPSLGRRVAIGTALWRRGAIGGGWRRRDRGAERLVEFCDLRLPRVLPRPESLHLPSRRALVPTLGGAARSVAGVVVAPWRATPGEFLAFGLLRGQRRHQGLVRLGQTGTLGLQSRLELLPVRRLGLGAGIDLADHFAALPVDGLQSSLALRLPCPQGL